MSLPPEEVLPLSVTSLLLLLLSRVIRICENRPSIF